MSSISRHTDKKGEKLEEKNVKKNRPDDAPDWMISWTQIDEVKFGTAFLKEHELKCVNGMLYGIDGYISEDAVKADIMKMLIPYYTTKLSQRVKNLLDTLKMLCHSEEENVRTDEIHLLNGVMKTDGTWTEGKQFCVNRLNIEYHPEIRKGAYYPEKFLNFLCELLEPKDIDTLQEYLGYCLIPSTKAQVMLYLIGSGGEGKSRIGVVLKEIFNEAMIEAKLHRVGTDRFFTANLVDKLICLDDDMEMAALTNTSELKKLITAEIAVDVERKGQQSFQKKLYSRFIAFSNGSPKALYDKSDGFTRRLLILTTKPKPENRKDDPFLAEKFIAEKEKIFCWMFDGLRRLLERNYRFTISERTKQNIIMALSENCNIYDFLHDETMIAFGADYKTTNTDLYALYQIWCSDNGLTALKRESFISFLKSNEKKFSIAYDYNIINEKGRRVRGFTGMKTLLRTSVTNGV